jgi:hypothetical protein
MLNEWLADESGDDEATWLRLKQALEETRTSRWKRFAEDSASLTKGGSLGILHMKNGIVDVRGGEPI